MLKRTLAVYLVTTALTVAPALAQNNSSANANTSQEATNGQAVSTSQFVTQAAEGGLFEVQSSQLALKKSQDKDIRNFAQRMIHDHTQANEKLKSVAKNETVPTSLDAPHQQILSKLQGEDGSNFADQFKQAQVQAHEQAISLFQNYGQHGSDAQVKQFAQQTLPTLREHLQMAQQITIANNGNQNQQTAQNAGNAGNAANASNAGNRNYITQESPGTWRASKVIGLGVYNEQNEKVGNINEVLFDRSGKVEGVVIGVGGFLGIGERNVAVPYSELKWAMTSPQAQHTAANTAATGTNPAATGTNPAATGTNRPGLGNPASPVNPAPTVTGNTRTASADANQTAAYPDHAILPNASKDQLHNAPQFQYGGAPR